jgi:hypothetical protein
MKREKTARKNLNIQTELTKIIPVLGRGKKMKEEKTQGIDADTTIKDSHNTTEPQERQNYLTLGRVTSNTPAHNGS